MRQALILISLLFFFHQSFSQKKCGTDEYHQLLNRNLSKPESDAGFEGWLKEKIEQKKSSYQYRNKAEETILTIPVVVHIVHQGESLGTKSNIPDEQIHSQIDILNEDFRRLNEDASNTPTEFLSVAADVKIEFVLAKRDPEGLPTNAIERIKGPLGAYGFSTNMELKSQSYWPAEDYLNLWVTTLADPLLGYAQFPTSNLEGLNTEQSISRLTDGIVVDYRFLGEGHNAVAFSKGRTATHEIGHFLGLKHIWGSDCSTDDFCDDTPNKSGSTQGCPAAGSIETCGSIDMFQNFLDLSDDVCMNLFTLCQGQRMRTVLENSPRRKSLLTSKALQDPVIVMNDLGIKQILSPHSGDCKTTIAPQVEVRNYGINTISDFKIDLFIDENFVETVSQNTIISELSTAIVSFSEINITESRNSIYKFEIAETNGGTDGNPENNSKSAEVSFLTEEQIPYMQDFESPLVSWQSKNSNGVSSAWTQGQAPYNVIDNTGMSLSYYGSLDEKFGETDILMSPVFDLSSLPSADISFKYAYAAIEGNVWDVFTIAVSTDCGNTFPEENYIYQRFSPLLSTTGLTTDQFIPEGPDDWIELEINITEFVGHESVVIGFIGHNGGGNNLYLDDFSITSENKLDYDLALKSVDQIPPVTCDGNIFPSIEIKNFGTRSITDFILNYSLDGDSESLPISGLNLLPGKIYIARPSIQGVSDGSHEITFTVENPNGNLDGNSENDVINVFFKISDLQEPSPTREYFEESTLNEKWNVVRPDGENNWTLTDAPSEKPSNQALLVNGYNMSALGVENWLISPVLDFSSTNEASMAFKVSYANVPGRNDGLKVLVSLNCGRSYDKLVYNKKGGGLAVTQQTEEWFPSGIDDWKTEIIDLSEFTIWPQVRVAFVVTNQNGNNLYLDDIEFFNSVNPNNILDIKEERLRVYPNPAESIINLKFDLSTKTSLVIQMVDMMGKVVHESLHPSTLNQTYQIDGITVDNGIYLVNVIGSDINFSKRVLIWN